MGSDPPLVSISMSDRMAPVETFTDATCAMWITSSLWPIHFGLYWTTLSFVIATCVGNRRLPELQRLARDTSPAVNGSPFLTTTQTSSATTPRAAAPPIHSHV